MVSGFFLGGAAEGFNQTEQQIYQQGILKLAQQRQQAADKQQQIDNFQNQYKEFLARASETVGHDKDGMIRENQTIPDDILTTKVTNGLNKAYGPLADMLANSAKILGLPVDPHADLSNIYNSPAPSRSARQQAEATGQFGERQAGIAEKQAQTQKIQQESEILKNEQEFERGLTPTGQTTPTAQPGTPGAASTTDASGEAFLNKIPNAAVRQQVKDVAEYRLNPNTFSARIPRGGNMSPRQLMTGLAEQYAAERGERYDAAEFPARSKTISNFAGGQESRQVRSYNVLVDHLDVLNSAINDLKGSNSRVSNTVKNFVADQLGSTAPNDFNAVRDLVAREVVKAVEGGAGALGDRTTIESRIENTRTPQQLRSVLQEYVKLAGGQLGGLRKTYETTGRQDFDTKFLTDRTRKLFNQPQSSSGMSGTSGDVKFSIGQ